MNVFLRCFGQAFLKHGLKAACDLVPFGGAAYDIAVDGWASYCKERPARDLQGELKETVQATGEQLTNATAQVVAAIAADRNKAGHPITPQERQRLGQYLEQVPRSIRQSFRRPSDPTGRTVPGSLRVEKPEDLITVLPGSLPRFREGQMPLAGTDLELLELLGMGGFGEVWKARHRDRDPRRVPPVALKFCTDKQAALSLRREVDLLDRIAEKSRQHELEGVVRLIYAHTGHELPCLEYEYIAGGDLSGMIREWQRTRGGAPPRQAASLVRDLAEVVGFAHRLDPPIVHRDLKPANILVQKDKEGRFHFKVGDFGIGAVVAKRELAEHSRRPTSYVELLTTGVRGAYTLLYASPQQQAGQDPDPRDDVHALGVIWHQLLSGDLMKGCPGGDAWKRRVTSQGMAQELIDLLVSCCEELPDDRPDDAMDLAERLARIISPSTVTGAGKNGPNKEQVYWLWVKDPKGNPENWHKHIKERVKLQTIKGWTGQWQQGKNIPAGPKRVIARIVTFLTAATKTAPITKATLLEKLAERFPDRTRDEMKATIDMQLSGKGLIIEKDDKGGFWAKDTGLPPPSGANDPFGSRVGNNTAKFNAVLCETPQTMSELVKKAGVPGTYYEQINWLIGRGLAVKTDDGKYAMSPAGAAVWAAAPTGACGASTVFGHSPHRIVQWMGMKGWTFERAKKALEKLGITHLKDVSIRTYLADGKNPTYSKPAALTGEQQQMLAKAAE